MRRKYLIFLFFPIIVIVVSGFAQDLKPLMNWEHMISDAKRSDKYIYLHCSYKECRWCYKMEKETYADDTVEKLLDKDYIMYKILREDSLWPLIRLKYRVRAFPTFLIISPDGRLVAKKTGYMKPARFAEYLENIDLKNPGKDFPGVSDTLDLPLPYSLKKTGNYYNLLSENERKELCTFWDSQDNKFSESCWSILYLYNLGESCQKFFLDNYEQYARLFSYDEAEDKLKSIMSELFLSALKNNDSGKLNAIDTLIHKYYRHYKELYKLFYRISFAYDNNDNAFLMHGLLALMADRDWNEVFYIGDVYRWTNKVCNQMDSIHDVVKFISFYKEQVKNDPGFDSNYLYAYLLYKIGEFELAEKYADKAMSLATSPGTSNYNDINNLIDKIKKSRNQTGGRK